MKLELQGNRDKALRLIVEHRRIMEKIKSFVGEHECKFDGGLSHLREIATNGIVEAYGEQEDQWEV